MAKKLQVLIVLVSLCCRCSGLFPWPSQHEDHQAESTADKGCGGMLTSSSGIITSPKYPYDYPSFVSCVWNITVPGQKRVSIEFTDFEIEMSHGCEYDAVEIYEGALNNKKRIARLCGNERPKKLSPKPGPVLVTFHSDYSVSFKGFSLHYSTSGCDQILTAPSGEITSPNHPENYPASMECSYKIVAPKGKQIVLSFIVFDTEQPEDGSKCMFDYVEVLDGEGTASPVLGRFCGPDIPEPLRSSGTHLVVHFVADASIHGKGFRASYYTEDSSGGDCMKNNGGCEHVCTNYPEGIKCSCNRGFVLDSDGFTCTDVDECLKNNGGCEDICVNTPGSYRCECRVGFELREDKVSCLNINECAVQNGNCEHMCSDTDGSYYCSCFRGSRLSADKRSCEDINECKWPRNRHHCEHICRNMPGSYYCDCRPGFVLSANQRMCIDMDECLMGGNKCEQLCVNTPGSYHCECRPGYVQHPILKNKCIDIEECLEGLPDCHVCTNLQGGYECSCDKGYHQVGNKTACVDNDECAENNGDCPQACVNFGGGFECKCWDGYEPLEDSQCTDIDECAANSGNGPCSHTCTNTQGSFNCSCPDGYSISSDNRTCEDIDECSVNNGGCKHKCINLPGNFTCGCFDGYENLGKNGQDFICKDIDECTTGSHKCNKRSTCINTPGNYSCVCPSGFVSHWYNCTDINECQDLTLNKCGQECVNIPGSFYCACKDGFELSNDNNTCVDLNECEMSMCEHECVNSPGSYKCSCQEGFELNSDKKSCRDINECETDNGSCDQICSNTNGSYICNCIQGFELSEDGKSCNDVNECSNGLACCNQKCLNTKGDYQCLCNPGYAIVSGKCDCSDIDECQANNGGCQQICMNSPGSYSCTCKPGFIIDPEDLTKCIDINECLMDNGGCSQMCNNTAGGYFCSCRPVFKLATDGKTCDHCPTCETFESLIHIIEDLQKQVVSLQAWRASRTSGCSYGTQFFDDGVGWKPFECRTCVCEVGQVICYNDPKCNSTKDNTSTGPGKAGGPEIVLLPDTPQASEGGSTDVPGQDEIDTEITSSTDQGSGEIYIDGPTTEAFTKTENTNQESTKGSKTNDDELFSIHKRRLT